MAVRNLQFVLSGQDKSAGKTLDKVGGKADGLARKLGGLGGALVGGAAVAGVVGFAKSSVEAFQEAERSAAELEFAFAKFPKLGDSNAEAFRKLNEELALKTRFDDDATASGQAVLAQFGLTGKEILKVTPLLQDYAARTGKELPDAAKDLGKAFQGNAKALKPLGIQLKSTGDRAKDFDAVQKALNEKVGGFAAKEGATAAGKAEILANRFGELKETVGAQLLPVVTQFVDYLSTDVVPKVQELADGFANGTGPGGELKDVLGGMRDVVKDMVPTLKVVAETTVDFIQFCADHPTAVRLIAEGVAAYAVAMKAASIWTGAMAAINLGKTATGVAAVGTSSAAAAPGVAALGGAAMRSAGPIAALAVALVELSNAGKLDFSSFGKGGDLDRLINAVKAGDSGSAWDALWGEGFSTAGGPLATWDDRRDQGALESAQSPTPRPGGSSQDRLSPVNPPTKTFPRNGQVASFRVANSVVLDGRVVATSTNTVNAAKVRNGATPAYVP